MKRYFGYCVYPDGTIIGKNGNKLKQFTKKTVPMGYLYVSIMVCGKCTQRSVHSIVFGAYHGDVPDGMVIDHNDGNPLNNHEKNLVARTHVDNCRKGDSTKLTEEEVREIKIKIENGARGCDLAREYNISQQVICDIRMGRRWVNIH